MTAILDIADLSVHIASHDGEAHILDNVSLSINRGESVGLIGESGSGKSMTALAIMGLLPEQAERSGTIRFLGEDLIDKTDAQMSAIRGDQIAMVFQEPMTALNPVHTIGDQVAEGLRLHQDRDARSALDEAVRLLDRVGLPPERFSPSLYPHELSGGQRQRVGIAAALACGPDLLIADEPTTALDVTTQAQILDLLAEIAAEDGMALLFITHDLGVIAEMTDAMLVMYAGTVVERGTTARVFAEMAHPYTDALFKAMPQTRAPGERLAAIEGQVRSPAEPRIGCPFANRCARADDLCWREAPPIRSIAMGHEAMCFHPLVEGLTV